MDNKQELPKRLARKTIYENKWVSLYLDKVQFPDGRIIDEHHLIEFDYDSVGVVVLNAKEEILLIRSSRYTTQRVEWEIPAGGIDEGETPEEAARREVQEETGYMIGEMRLLCKENPLNGIANKIHYIYKAMATAKGEMLTPEEVCGMEWFSFAQVRELISAGEIACDLSLVGTLMVLGGF